MDAQQRVDFVAVNYFSQSAAARLISSLTRQGDPRWRLTIVDNSCDESEFAALVRHAQADGRIHCIRSSGNLGYLGGARLGMNRQDPSAWKVLCNVDLLFADDFVRMLLSQNYVGVPAPSIMWRSRDQNPFLRTRPTSRLLRRWELQFRWVPVARAAILVGALLAAAPSSRRPSAGTPIYAAHGSCVVLPDAYFERGGTLHYPGFLFGEEIYIAEQCRQLGIDVTYQPELKVSHVAHASTGLLRSRYLIKVQRDSLSHTRLILESSEA